MSESTTLPPQEGQTPSLDVVTQEQDTIDGILKEDLSPDDRQAAEQLRAEVDGAARSASLPEGRAVHLDAQGNALTDEEYAEQQQNIANGEAPEYGQGGTRS